MSDVRPSGRLAENVVHFARVLRAAGIPAGTDRVVLALRALGIAGLESRDDFREVLAACLTDRIEQRDLFDQAFHLFWRDPDLLGRMLAMLLPRVEGPEAHATPPRENRRLADALFAPKLQPPPREDEEKRIEVDASLSFSAREVLRKADFDTMSADEWRAALRVVAQWRAQLPRVRTRRFEPAARGTRLDWRRIAARSARRGGELAELAWRRPSERPTPVVALVDISGSMSRYSRTFLHFLHALTSAWRHTSSFVFGTRLTPVTRMLRHRDPDRAIDECVRVVDDWSGGTRISTCLREFNLRWSRRVLGGNATVILVTDGLERDDAGGLGFEAERLSKSCRRLLWLNPLLRYDAFEPRAAGVRAILPHVDAHLPVHNLASLEGLADALADLSRHARPDHRSGAPRRPS
ncbi:MAG: VWA domain-containing protein [Burkholderiaceae bacterium]